MDIGRIDYSLGVTSRAGLRGGATGAIAPDPRCKGAPVMKLMFQIKYSFEKFS